MAIFSSPQIQALVSKPDVLANDPELRKILWTSCESQTGTHLSLVDELRFRVDNHLAPAPVDMDQAAEKYIDKCFPEEVWGAYPPFHKRFQLAVRHIDPIHLQSEFVHFVRTIFGGNTALVLKPVNEGKLQVYKFVLTPTENLRKADTADLFMHATLEMIDREKCVDVVHLNSSESIYYNGDDIAWALKPWSVSYSENTSLRANWVVENPFNQLELSFDTFIKHLNNAQFDGSPEFLESDLETQLLRLQSFAVGFFHDLFLVARDPILPNGWAFSKSKVDGDLARISWNQIKPSETENVWVVEAMHRRLKALQRICFSLTRSLADRDEALAYYYCEASEIESGFAVSKVKFQFLSAIFKSLVNVFLNDETAAKVNATNPLNGVAFRNHLLNKQAHLFWRNLTNAVNLNLEDFIERKWWPVHAKSNPRDREVFSILYANGQLDIDLRGSLKSFLAFGAPNPDPKIVFISGHSIDGPTALDCLPILAFAASQDSDLVTPAEVTVENKPTIALAVCPSGSGIFSEKLEIGYSPSKEKQDAIEQTVVQQVNETLAFSGLQALIRPFLVQTRTWKEGLDGFSFSIASTGTIPESVQTR